MRGLLSSFLLRLKVRNLTSPLCTSQSRSRSFLFTSPAPVVKISYLSPKLCNLPNFHAHFSTTPINNTADKETVEERNNELKIEIISEENIKPSSATPDHLKTHEVSVFDQLFPHMHMPFIYFYANEINHQDDNLIQKRRQLLKQSLSETLTRFYPLAGKVKDNRHIDCNDDGVYYVEAKASNFLSDFLKHPDDNKSINRLLPFDPNSIHELLSSKTYLVMIQVTVFGCGGMAIGLYTSHKIIDGFTHATFLKAWAATTRELGSCSENRSININIHPNFKISPSTFPSNPTLPADAKMLFLTMLSGKKNKRARFVFSASSIATLKKKAGASSTSSRVMAVTGLIWKCVMAASSKARSKDSNKCDNIPRSSALTLAVNLRERSSPPMPPYTVGNMVWSTSAIMNNISTAYDDDDDDLRSLNSIIQGLKNSVDIINSDFIEKMKGEEGSLQVVELWKERKLFRSKENIYYFGVTSLCRNGNKEIDFGWGRPIWVSNGIADTDTLLTNVVVLMDTRSGNGIEAWVTLTEEEMAFLERDPQILAFASLNPSPLEIVDW
ncbi:hypothetical protein ACJIZ3_019225 [Penstemon smallii]|uniref:Uncharacterized protein n=1 Tax=Penstemon smallii TaxID=265156 RepID=A0ABD3T165_9LAMI